uniref:Uncharacterized protein n=1 Tax=Echinococcus granulosus TaxID=6210 RepID=A0A068WI16_ECHGR|nr:hypothetical protein EgrG_000507500 [Echinococcus granulosus]
MGLNDEVALKHCFSQALLHWRLRGVLGGSEGQHTTSSRCPHAIQITPTLQRCNASHQNVQLDLILIADVLSPSSSSSLSSSFNKWT